MNTLSGILEKWEPVIGLEVHAQLSTHTKMFCSCKNAYGDSPNTNSCPICLGLPGSLPVANRQAIEFALKLGCALGCKINRTSIFARKNYFYPDLPKGYQISQYENPLCVGGGVVVREGEKLREVPLIRIHLEEDAGKLVHSSANAGRIEDNEESRVDFNRCGVPLVEIVTAPVMHTPKEAKEYFTRLRQVLGYLNICDCNMEQGNIRCDANISLRKSGSKEFGTRTEMKNMNSFRSVERALTFEIERQTDLLESGENIDQVTLLWDEIEQKAEIMRGKEEAHDYRYFPDPDLVPIVIQDEQIARIRESLGNLPHEVEEKLMHQYQLRCEDAVTLASDPFLADYYEETIRLGAIPKVSANWILTEILRVVKDQFHEIKSFPVQPYRFVELLEAVNSGRINANTAKTIFNKMLNSNSSPLEIIKEEGLSQISDTSELQEIIDKLIVEYPDELTRYRQGKKALLGFFMGQVMNRTEGKSDPKVVRTLLSKALES